MTGKGKITASAWLLLVLTALFLLALLRWGAIEGRERSGGYEVIVSRGSDAAVGKLSLNTATAGELEMLQGIGPVLARRIVVYREAHGPFTDVRQLLQVQGIGEKTLENIRDYVTLEVEDEDSGGG